MKDDQVYELLNSMSQEIGEIKKLLNKVPKTEGFGKAAAQDEHKGENNVSQIESRINEVGQEIVRLRHPLDAILNSVYPNTKSVIISYIWPWQRLAVSATLGLILILLGAVLFVSFHHLIPRYEF